MHQSTKLALDLEDLNECIHKNKNSIPNIDFLFQTISQTLTNAPNDTAYFKTIELQYLYSQLNSQPDFVQHFNFSLFSGNMAGTNRFKTVFYGLPNMPAEIQKAMNCTLIEINGTFCFATIF